jgi:hypothetical protein
MLVPPQKATSGSRETLLAQQLVHTQHQFERLKQDFTYNLQLLRERDAELERNDQEVRGSSSKCTGAHETLLTPLIQRF